MSFIFTLYRAGIAWLFADRDTVIDIAVIAVFVAVVALFVVVYRMACKYDARQGQESVERELATEPLPAVQRYVQEVCEVLRMIEERERQTDNLS